MKSKWAMISALVGFVVVLAISPFLFNFAALQGFIRIEFPLWVCGY